MLTVSCLSQARWAQEDLAGRAVGRHGKSLMGAALDRNDHLSRAHVPHIHHGVVLEPPGARVSVSAPRAQVQRTLVAAERHPFGTSLVALLLCLGEVVNFDNVAHHMVRDEVSG